MKLSGMTPSITLEVPEPEGCITPSNQTLVPLTDTVKHTCLQTFVTPVPPVTTLSLKLFAPIPQKILAFKSAVPALIMTAILPTMAAEPISKIRLLSRTTVGETRNQVQTENSIGIYGDGIRKAWDAVPLKTALNDALPNAPWACATGGDWEGTRLPVTLATSWSSWFGLNV
jgi:hypothetical protein